MRYSLVDNIRHCEQTEAEAVKWHEAMDHFKSDREKDAYRAGYERGCMDQRGHYSLHGGVRLAD